jgi:hypothetical protein
MKVRYALDALEHLDAIGAYIEATNWTLQRMKWS